MSDRENRGLAALKGAGWQAGRRVAVDAYLAALRKEGYQVSEQIEGFLAEYGGLQIGEPASGFAKVVAINPVTAAETIYREAVEAYEEAVDTRLVPIGAAYSGHLILMLGEDGRFFGGYDAYFAFVGCSPVEMFGRIVARDLEEIGGVDR